VSSQQHTLVSSQLSYKSTHCWEYLIFGNLQSRVLFRPRYQVLFAEKDPTVGFPPMTPGPWVVKAHIFAKNCPKCDLILVPIVTWNQAHDHPWEDPFSSLTNFGLKLKINHVKPVTFQVGIFYFQNNFSINRLSNPSHLIYGVDRVYFVHHFQSNITFKLGILLKKSKINILNKTYSSDLLLYLLRNWGFYASFSANIIIKFGFLKRITRLSS
jgi:hypothetical protein